MLKSKNKIALVIRLLPNRSGGAERLFCELANMLNECGQDVTCIYYDDADGLPFFQVNKGVKLLNLSKKKGSLKSSYRMSKFVRRLYTFFLEKLPGVIVNRLVWEALNRKFINGLKSYFTSNKIDLAISFLPTANTVTLLAARETNTKVIVTNHNVPEEDYNSPLRWDPNPYDRELRIKSLEFADAIHVLFPGFANWFPANLEKKIVAIPNYVSDEFSRGVNNALKGNVILAVGRLAYVKNYIVLLQAWHIIAERFPDWKVVLYGGGPQQKLLEKKIRELGVEDSFFLRGHKANLAEDYASASIFCHPALFEGFGLSVAEALTFELPVVAFDDCAGVNEYVKDGFNGVLVSRLGGSEALAEGLDKLIQDEKLRLEVGQNGPASIAEYTRQNYFSRWCELIEKVIE